ncbi:MAG: hypothetical protein C9356_12025 [Oleiphilus sp.]|nr:MAG: hypothetical protein C9356_12025 [Oleiphilus sp.]
MGEQNLLKVGDILVTKTFMGTHKYPITRVTKTLAKSKRKSDGYEYTFKREISDNMSHPCEQWSTTEYNVIKQ